MAGDESLGDFLAHLRGAGDFDSEGGFSIDLHKAIERLESVALVRPDFYFRHIAASAIASGATRVRARSSGREVCFEHNGQAMDFETMQAIFPSLFMTPLKARSYLRELAVGLHGARMAGLNPVVLESWTGTEGARLKLVGGKLEISPLKTPPRWAANGVTCSVTVKEPKAFMDYFLVNQKPPKEPDWRHLRYAPIPIDVNGQICNQPFEPQDPLLLLGLRGTDESLPTVALPEGSPMAEIELPLNGCLYLTRWEGDPVNLVVHGIDYPCRLDLGLAGTAGIIYCNEFQRDASLLGVVENEFLELLRSRLAQELARAVVRSRTPSLDSALIAHFRQAVGSGLVSAHEVSSQGGIKAFKTTDGPMTLGELEDSYRECGFLCVDDHSRYRPPPPALVVTVEDWCRELLQTRFACWVELKTLRGLYFAVEAKERALVGIPFAFRHEMGVVFAHLRLPATPFLRPARLLLVSKGRVFKESWLSDQPRGLEVVFEMGPHRHLSVSRFLGQVLAEE
ncbi:MAG: hypothetical protein KC910_28980, partial [Candidatus Eremiobacteraeota bacterium]|nr:hypothetical protein [Candidatus Eremiobacteraeota bacterium]